MIHFDYIDTHTIYGQDFKGPSSYEQWYVHYTYVVFSCKKWSPVNHMLAK